MKRMPTTAKLTASSRRLRTTNLSAFSPCIRGTDWLISLCRGAARYLA